MNKQQIVVVIICVLSTLVTRFLPFLIFRPNKPTPKVIDYLGKALPASIFATLVIYCLKDVNFFGYTFGLPELISIIVVVLLHLWKRHTLLSVGIGTLLYVLLVNFVFI